MCLRYLHISLLLCFEQNVILCSKHIFSNKDGVLICCHQQTNQNKFYYLKKSYAFNSQNQTTIMPLLKKKTISM